MSGEHTPGPWEYRDNCIYPTSRQRCIARMDWHVRDEVDDANARLIAAAPDLLDELRAVVAAIGEWARPTGSNGMIPAGESHPLVVAARAGSAAISKAEGK